jgi:hypothetical protein
VLSTDQNTIPQYYLPNHISVTHLHLQNEFISITHLITPTISIDLYSYDFIGFSEKLSKVSTIMIFLKGCCYKGTERLNKLLRLLSMLVPCGFGNKVNTHQVA